ncbi:MAG: hypothetical protein ABSD76_00225 [Terriglobales bacterium]
MSRGFVEDAGLTQTAQSSDQIDKEYGIWHCVFLDHVDIHERAGRKKGPNQYGPVLFVLEPDVLLRLPEGSDIRVARENPIYWRGKPDGQRWFENLEDLANNIHFGDFGKMLMIQTPSGALDFPGDRARIILDCPGRKLQNGKDAFSFAEGRLRAAAETGGTAISIEKRNCQSGCICVDKYAAYSAPTLEFWFG